MYVYNVYVCVSVYVRIYVYVFVYVYIHIYREIDIYETPFTGSRIGKKKNPMV